MALVLGVTLLATCLAIGKADYDQIVQRDVTGTWKRSVVLPCSYPPADHEPHTITWLYNGRRIFERDNTGDHTFLTKYRGRLSLPEDLQEGDVSLTILNLETDDRGLYTCKVTFGLKSTSGLTFKEDNIHLDVLKAAPVATPTIPIIKMASIKVRSTTGRLGNAREHEAHQPIATASTKADFNLTVQQDVTGRRKSSVVLPCSYSPADHTPHTVTWLYNGRRIFERDDTGDHTLVTKYRGRLSLPEDLQAGDVSLTILNLETDDRGLYTCKVTLGLKSTSGRTSKEDNIHLDLVMDVPVPTMIPPKVWMSSTEQMITTEWPGGTEGNDAHQTKAPASTQDPHRSPGMPPFLVIVFVVLSIALLCILIAVIVCRTKNKKSDGIYEIPTMSALNAREGQDSSAVNVCNVTICQTNVVQNTCPQGNGCLAEDLTTHTNKNDYEQVTIKKQRPEIDIYLNKESEYEQLLPEREHV